MIAILLEIWKNKTLRLILIACLAIFAIGAVFAYLTHERARALREAEKIRQENERLERKNEGLEIIANSANKAAEIEKEREKANAQSANSNLSNGLFTNSVMRDSGTFSGNAAGVKERFCRNFPNDSACR